MICHKLLPQERLQEFKRLIWNFYSSERRIFSWRLNLDPYAVLVSEIMLQQTQTSRVVGKYEHFLEQFPNFETLALAPLRNVLVAWQGLGYSRRAKALHDIAKIVHEEYGGLLPGDPQVLIRFPGIGKGTAGSICAFAYNKPTVFIETNIRSVFIESFFRDAPQVHDRDIMPLIAATVDQENPREWYYALMDYGVHLKKNFANPNVKSVHHTKQSKFNGSDRQIRGAILRFLAATNREVVFCDIINYLKNSALDDDPARAEKILAQLCRDQMVKKCGDLFFV